MTNTREDRELQKIAVFEDRMGVLGKDNPKLAEACRHAHTTIRAAKHVAESIFNDDMADNPEVVMAIHAAIADDYDDIRAQEDVDPDDLDLDDEDDED